MSKKSIWIVTAIIGLLAVLLVLGGPQPLDQTVSQSVISVTEVDGPLCSRFGAGSITVNNPIITGDRPDPSVVRVLENGCPAYYLTHTVHNNGDLPLFRSGNLGQWGLVSDGIFQRNGANPFYINGENYCSVWAPHLFHLGSGAFMLSYSAGRFNPPAPSCGCPAYHEDGGVYLAYAPGISAQFAPEQSPWEPLPAGAFYSCGVREQLPRSVNFIQQGCPGGRCQNITRLDSDVFIDPADGRYWMAYSWFMIDPADPQYTTLSSEHASIVELNPADPFTVRCDANVPVVHAGNPIEPGLIDRLRDYCPRCGEMLSNTKGRFGEELTRDGRPWGISEGASLFRRGNYVYLLLSGSAWDSPYYHVYWVAAPTVEELSYNNPNRLIGRYLIPSQGQAFGHGSAVLGPNGRDWYFVHHRLDGTRCQTLGRCERDVWISPIEFENRGDGRGAVYIKPRFPAETRQTTILLR